MNKNKILSMLAGFLIGALLTFGLGVVAYNGIAPKVVVEGDYIEAAQPAQEITLGGLVHNILESFNEGIAVDGTTIIDGSGNFTIAGTISSTGANTFTGAMTLSSDFSSSGTTTIPRLDSNIDVSLSWTPTTTATTEKNVLARYQNDGNDLFCDPSIVDISTAVGAFGANYSVGTTTLKDGLYLTNTSSATLIGLTAINTTTAGMLIAQTVNDQSPFIIGADTAGTYYTRLVNGLINGAATGTQPFILKSGELIVVYSDYSGATSTDSWTNGAAAFAGVGKLHVNCRNRF